MATLPLLVLLPGADAIPWALAVDWSLSGWASLAATRFRSSMSTVQESR